jgi:universal stress protein A
MTSKKRILVAVDFSPTSRAAFAEAVNLARGVGGTVEVVHVYEPSAYMGPQSLVLVPVNLAQKWELTRAHIVKELEVFLGAGHGAAALHVEIGQAADAIPALARSGKYDLVFMGAHGGGGISRVVGKVTEAVMKRAPCAVLTIHLPERTARETIPL